jgi:hypothetical protein
MPGKVYMDSVYGYLQRVHLINQRIKTRLRVNQGPSLLSLVRWDQDVRNRG